jgi:hypothetical protein
MIGSRPGRSHTGPSCQIPKTFERVNCLRPLCPAQAISLSCFTDYRTAFRLQDASGVCCTLLCWVSPPVIVVGRRCKHVPRQLVGSMGSSTAALRAQPVCRGVANRAVFLPGVCLEQDLQRAKRPRSVQQERKNLVPGEPCSLGSLSSGLGGWWLLQLTNLGCPAGPGQCG